MITWKKFKELFTKRGRKKLLEELRKPKNMAAMAATITEVTRWMI